MTHPNRRAVLSTLTLGALSAGLAACSRPQAPTAPSAAPSTPPPSSSATAPAPVDPDWDALRQRLAGTLALPEDADYGSVKLVENPRFDAAAPRAVVSVATPDDVVQAVLFARDSALPVVVRSGGHGYTGYSSGDVPGVGLQPSLVIDVRGLAGITVAGDGAAVVGAGASLIMVYDAVGAAGRAIAGGSCATVGITGLTLGGGVGVLTRAYGLTCDALVSVDVVTPDGIPVTATADENPDVLFACRGGGGQVGVVTSLTFATVPAPVITTAFLAWAFDDAVPVILAWQRWAPEADPGLWSTLKLLSGTRHAEPTLQLTVTWTGPSADLAAQLEELHRASGVQPLATDVQPDRTYLDVMFGYAGCADIPVDACSTGPSGALEREAFSAASHVPYDLLDETGALELVRQCEAGHTSGAVEAAVSLDALGGAVRDLGVEETGFGHRAALATVQYTATYAAGGAPAPFDAFVRGARAAMVPFWGEGAYANYADATLADPGSAYFGANAQRLAGIRSSVDPDGVFATQPSA